MQPVKDREERERGIPIEAFFIHGLHLYIDLDWNLD